MLQHIASAEVPPDHRDYIDPAALAREHEITERQYERELRDEAHVLRAEIISKLIGAEALGPHGMGWVVYDANLSSSGSVSLNGSCDYLILATRPVEPTHEHQPPRLRIISNEIIMNASGVECLTQDFTVAEDDSARYFVDAINVGRPEELFESLAPVFSVSAEGTITFSANTRLTTPLANPKLEVDEPIALFPLGHTVRLEDQLYALEMGRELLDTIGHLEPVASAAF